MSFSAHRQRSSHSPTIRARTLNASTPVPDPPRHMASPSTSHPRSHPIYELCPACGAKVSPRDNGSSNAKSDGLEGHKANCLGSARLPPSLNTGSSSRLMPIPTPLSSSSSSSFPVSPTTLGVSHNPTRRRAKRTEEERIEYLRNDPHVAKYEPYRVLCAVCDKWIRLRPNSTYCSIPWDAHRKSCLGRKLPQNDLAADKLTYVLTSDPHVRKFDAERALCGLCDQWISLPSDDPEEARNVWHAHRSLCAKSLREEKPELPGSETQDKGMRRNVQASHGDTRHTDVLSPVTVTDSTRYPPFPPSPTTYASTTAGSHSATSPSLSEMSSSTHSRHAENPYSSQADARRRNADQRLASLQADSLISIVEPNRVFCRICEKWVQLRQDSSYCAYPWIMHRGKCLRRRERRAAKAEVLDDRYSHSMPSSSKMAPIGYNLFPTQPASKDVLDSDKSPTSIHAHRSQVYSSYSTSSSRRRESPTPPRKHHESRNKGTMDDPISADEGGYINERYVARPENRDMGQQGYHRPSRAYSPRRAERHHQLHDVDASSYRHPGPNAERLRTLSRSDVLENSSSDIDMSSNSGDSDNDDELNSPTRKSYFGAVELHSFEGRHSFIRISISHLFSTSYAVEDKIPIASLVAYLNVAIPEGKYEEFGTREVARSVARLAEQGLVVWEGDIIRSASAGRRS